MNPERWQRLKELFQAALERDPASRTAFLDKACAGDARLREEVRSLLSGHQEDSFLERPVYQEAAELFEDTSGESLVGHHLGPYLLSKKLGEGGMGIVYLAEDTRLGRPVAIKALAPEYTSNEQHRQRLRREAQAAATLSHPGIATVYALEEFGEHLYIVSEYVPGETLRNELTRRPIPPAVLLQIGVQLAGALLAAHEHGVIHRDLKPENIIRTPQGTIKILDFGLARFQRTRPGDTVSAIRLTREGTFLGTPAYSSPEQLLVRELDFRTDIFSFGILLYELASGTHPFAGSDPVSTIARILEAETVELARLSPASPPGLDQILRRCLHKDPEQRYVSTRELLADLERLSLEVSESGSQPPVSKVTVGIVDGRRATRLSPLWWWQFHQAFVGFGYYLMLYPLWKAKQWTPGDWGSLIFFPAVMAVGIAANLRLHLWFTSRVYPAELEAQRRRVFLWLRCSDVLFILLLLAGAAAIHDSQTAVATLLVGVAIGSLAAFMLIEPATTRAALRNPSSGVSQKTHR